jgi:hypothetical protein
MIDKMQVEINIRCVYLLKASNEKFFFFGNNFSLNLDSSAGNSTIP